MITSRLSHPILLALICTVTLLLFVLVLPRYTLTQLSLTLEDFLGMLYTESQEENSASGSKNLRPQILRPSPFLINSTRTKMRSNDVKNKTIYLELSFEKLDSQFQRALINIYGSGSNVLSSSTQVERNFSTQVSAGFVLECASRYLRAHSFMRLKMPSSSRKFHLSVMENFLSSIQTSSAENNDVIVNSSQLMRYVLTHQSITGTASSLCFPTKEEENEVKEGVAKYGYIEKWSSAFVSLGNQSNNSSVKKKHPRFSSNYNFSVQRYEETIETLRYSRVNPTNVVGGVSSSSVVKEWILNHSINSPNCSLVLKNGSLPGSEMPRPFFIAYAFESVADGFSSCDRNGEVGLQLFIPSVFPSSASMREGVMLAEFLFHGSRLLQHLLERNLTLRSAMEKQLNFLAGSIASSSFRSLYYDSASTGQQSLFLKNEIFDRNGASWLQTPLQFELHWLSSANHSINIPAFIILLLLLVVMVFGLGYLLHRNLMAVASIDSLCRPAPAYDYNINDKGETEYVMNGKKVQAQWSDIVDLYPQPICLSEVVALGNCIFEGGLPESKVSKESVEVDPHEESENDGSLQDQRQKGWHQRQSVFSSEAEFSGKAMGGVEDEGSDDDTNFEGFAPERSTIANAEDVRMSCGFTNEFAPGTVLMCKLENLPDALEDPCDEIESLVRFLFADAVKIMEKDGSAGTFKTANGILFGVFQHSNHVADALHCALRVAKLMSIKLEALSTSVSTSDGAGVLGGVDVTIIRPCFVVSTGPILTATHGSDVQTYSAIGNPMELVMALKDLHRLLGHPSIIITEEVVDKFNALAPEIISSKSIYFVPIDCVKIMLGRRTASEKVLGQGTSLAPPSAMLIYELLCVPCISEPAPSVSPLGAATAHQKFCAMLHHVFHEMQGHHFHKALHLLREFQATLKAPVLEDPTSSMATPEISTSENVPMAPLRLLDFESLDAQLAAKEQGISTSSESPTSSKMRSANCSPSQVQYLSPNQILSRLIQYNQALLVEVPLHHKKQIPNLHDDDVVFPRELIGWESFGEDLYSASRSENDAVAIQQREYLCEILPGGVQSTPASVASPVGKPPPSQKIGASFGAGELKTDAEKLLSALQEKLLERQEKLKEVEAIKAQKKAQKIAKAKEERKKRKGERNAGKNHEEESAPQIVPNLFSMLDDDQSASASPPPPPNLFDMLGEDEEEEEPKKKKKPPPEDEGGNETTLFSLLADDNSHDSETSRDSLFEFFAPNGASYNSDEDSESEQEEVEPLSFRDVRGCLWFRSECALGSGAYGKVYLGVGDSGQLVAIKGVPVMKIDENEIAVVVKEVSLLTRMRNEYIVEYISGAIVGNYLMIVMEGIGGGSLFDLLCQYGSFDTMWIRRYLRDVLSALRYLHSNGLLHRDIKPHNVLLTSSGHCKLADFGCASFFGQSSTFKQGDIAGTLLYMAPEACKGIPHSHSDIWSVGIMAFLLATGNYPYPAGVVRMPHVILVELGTNPKFQPVLKELPDGDLKEFIKVCLTMDPDARPSADELLKHRFFEAVAQIE